MLELVCEATGGTEDTERASKTETRRHGGQRERRLAGTTRRAAGERHGTAHADAAARRRPEVGEPTPVDLLTFLGQPEPFRLRCSVSPFLKLVPFPRRLRPFPPSTPSPSQWRTIDIVLPWAYHSLPPLQSSDFTSAFPNSRKVYVEDRGVRVPFREIALGGGEAPLRVYDTSGPHGFDVRDGLPPLRRDWI